MLCAAKVAAHNEIYKLSPCGIHIRGHAEAGESKTLSPRLPISEWQERISKNNISEGSEKMPMLPAAKL